MEKNKWPCKAEYAHPVSPLPHSILASQMQVRTIILAISSSNCFHISNNNVLMCSLLIISIADVFESHSDLENKDLAPVIETAKWSPKRWSSFSLNNNALNFS